MPSPGEEQKETKRTATQIYPRKLSWKPWFPSFSPQIFFPSLYQVCLMALKELLKVLFFCKCKVKSCPGFWTSVTTEICIVTSAGSDTGKTNIGRTIRTWNSKHFDKETRMGPTRTCLVWPVWYPCGGSGRPQEARDTINLTF